MIETVDIVLEIVHPTLFDKNLVYRIPIQINNILKKKSKNKTELTVEYSNNALYPPSNKYNSG